MYHTGTRSALVENGALYREQGAISFSSIICFSQLFNNTRDLRQMTVGNRRERNTKIYMEVIQRWFENLMRFSQTVCVWNCILHEIMPGFNPIMIIRSWAIGIADHFRTYTAFSMNGNISLKTFMPIT
jgi:hypothetical protein